MPGNKPLTNKANTPPRNKEVEKTRDKVAKWKEKVTRHGWSEIQSPLKDLAEEEGASAMKREDCQNTFEGTKKETLRGKRGMELEEEHKRLCESGQSHGRIHWDTWGEEPGV